MFRAAARTGSWKKAVIAPLLAGTLAPAAAATGAAPPNTLREPAPPLDPSSREFRADSDRLAARRARLDTDSARSARAASRTAHRGLSAGSALTLARESFPAVMAGRLFDGREPLAGTAIVEHLGSGAALVRDGDAGSQRFVLQSSAPLEARDESDRYAPVDLSLRTRPDGSLRTVNSRAPLELAADRATATLAEVGISLTIPGRPQGVVESGGRAFYPALATDVDGIYVPQPHGFEALLQVRSAASPEAFDLQLGLPDGARAERARSETPIPGDPPQSIVVVKDGEPLAYVYPPMAYDADGQLVPTRMQLAGQSLALRVDHRAGDFRYPIMVDPEVWQLGDYWTGWPRWWWSQYLGGGAYGFGSAANDCTYYCGLYQSMPTRSWFNHGAYAHWYYRAPSNTYVYRAQLGEMAHLQYLCSGSLSCSRAFHGFMNPAYTAYESDVNYVNAYGGVGGNPFSGDWAYSGVMHDYCHVPRCTRSLADREHNHVLFGIQAQNPYGGPIWTGEDLNMRGRTTMGWAYVLLGDRYAPYLTSAWPGDRDWFDDGGGTHLVTPAAHDDGMGVYSLSLSGAASGGGTSRHGCSGNYDRSKCPPDWSTTFSYGLNQGTNSLSVRANDVADNPSGAQTWTMKVDRTPPSLTDSHISGGLWNARTQASDHRSEGVYASASLRVAPADAYSGVESIEVLVDEVSQVTKTCPTSACVLDWTFNPDLFADGVRTVRVVVKDRVWAQGGALQANHKAEKTFTVTVDRRGDIYAADELEDVSTRRVGIDYAKLSVRQARREAREYVKTRNGSEVRMRTRSTERDSTDEDAYWVRRSDRSDDPNLEPVASIIAERDKTSGSDWSLIETGVIQNAMQPWQYGPPARGTQYQRLRKTSSKRRMDVWRDATTRLPLKSALYEASSGTLLVTRYWSYSLERRQDSDYPSSFFAVARPQSTGMEEQEDFGSGGSNVRDEETGATFTGRYFGGSVNVGSQAFCFMRSLIHRQWLFGSSAGGIAEPVPLDAAESGYPGRTAPSTGVDAYYVAPPAGVACTALGLQRLYTPPLMVWTMASASSEAKAWTGAYRREGEHIQANPLDEDALVGGVVPVALESSARTAYAIRDDAGDMSSFLIDAPPLTILVRGPIAKSDIPILAASLRAMP